MTEQTRSEQHAGAGVVLPASALNEEVEFFTRLGLRVDSLAPADDPQRVTMSGRGLRLILERDLELAPSTLRLASRGGETVGSSAVSPNGTRVQLLLPETGPLVPELELAFGHASNSLLPWVEGRAGMLYQDLLPGRLGGGFVASRIRIPLGGPVPDSVHYHSVCFQLIYCLQGWVRVVYQDQGEPFVLSPGDGVLQPPGIRHRVLEASDGLEVLEVSCPAQHDTLFDHELNLPNGRDLGREYGGQRFVHHVASKAVWTRENQAGWEQCSAGMAAATQDQFEVQVLRPLPGEHRRVAPLQRSEFVFLYGLRGEAQLLGTFPGRIAPGDSIVLPGGHDFGLAADRDGTELLEVQVHAWPRPAQAGS